MPTQKQNVFDFTENKASQPDAFRAWLKKNTKELGSALSHAVQAGRLDLTKVALEFKHDQWRLDGCFVDSKSDVAILKLLLKAGANVHADDGKALFKACKEGNLEVVQFLIKAGVNPNEGNDEDHERFAELRFPQRPLVAAIVTRHVEITQYLIEHTAILELLQKAGATTLTDNELSLHEAIYLKRYKRVYDLIPKANRKELQFALVYAVQEADSESVNALLQAWPKGLSIAGALGSAAMRGHHQWVRPLVEVGAKGDINTVSSTFFSGTPLMRAIVAGKHSNKKTIEALLAAGADVNVEDEDGENALSLATRHTPHYVALLKKHGASCKSDRQILSELRKN